MILLKNTSESEELIVKDGVIAIARRICENKEYSKEFIMEVCGLTECGYEEAIKRAVVIDCVRKFSCHFRIEFLQEKFNLSAEEMKGLIGYKEGQKEKKQ